MAILCLSGWKQSGKDTVSDYLVKNHNSIRIAFADPLKDSVAEEFGIDRASLDDPKLKEKPILTMPVDPKDDFSRMITEFMRGEFRDQNGKRYGEGNENSIMYFTPRALCILKGSTNRSVRSNFWTQKAFKNIRMEMSRFDHVVVTDIRYKSEMEQFKKEFENETVFIRINRHTESPSNDPSERDLDDAYFDYYVENTGGLPYLYGQIQGIIESLNL